MGATIQTCLRSYLKFVWQQQIPAGEWHFFWLQPSLTHAPLQMPLNVCVSYHAYGTCTQNNRLVPEMLPSLCIRLFFSTAVQISSTLRETRGSRPTGFDRGSCTPKLHRTISTHTTKLRIMMRQLPLVPAARRRRHRPGLDRGGVVHEADLPVRVADVAPLLLRERAHILVGDAPDTMKTLVSTRSGSTEN